MSIIPGWRGVPSPSRSAWFGPLYALLLLLGFGASALGSPDGEVVVYVALDQEHSEVLFSDFEAKYGIKVVPNFDNELDKTVGLRRRIQEEASRPRCDVFWNNEVVNTVILKDAGLLEPYDSPSAADIPASFRDEDHSWTGFAARARVFIVNDDLVDAADRPQRMQDYLDPDREGNWCIAKPIAGTTATHFALLFETMGEEEAKSFLMGMRENGVKILSSNGMTMRQVSDGKVAYGLTDTDDFNVARLNGKPVSMVYPDQGEDDPGCVVIPNTIALIKGGPNPDNGRKFIDWALSREIEERLAHGRSAQMPVRADVPVPPEVRPIGDLKVQEVDFNAVAGRFESTQEWVQAEFLAEDLQFPWVGIGFGLLIAVGAVIWFVRRSPARPRSTVEAPSESANPRR